MTTQTNGTNRLRWFLVSSVLVNLALCAIVVSGNLADRAGELVNKTEWSVLAAARQHNNVAVGNKIVILPKAFGHDELDLVGIPTREGKEIYWILTNAFGVPSLKTSSNLKPRNISPKELEFIRSSVRTSEDVDTLLMALLH